MSQAASIQSLVHMYATALLAGAGDGQTRVIALDRETRELVQWVWDGGPPEYNWLFVEPDVLKEIPSFEASSPDITRFEEEIRAVLLSRAELRNWLQQALLDPLPATELIPAFANAVATAVLQYVDQEREPPELAEDNFIGVAFDFPSASFRCIDGAAFALATFRIDSNWRELFDAHDLLESPEDIDAFKQALASRVRSHSRSARYIEAIRAGME